MSALDFLRKQRLAQEEKDNEEIHKGSNDDEGGENVDKLLSDEYQLGSTKLLNSIDLNKLSRKELRAHAAARSLNAEGSKSELINLIKKSIAIDLETETGFMQTLDEERRMLADLEERGAVYAVGTNAVGQLGIGDIENRYTFTIIPSLMGLGIDTLVAGTEMSFAITGNRHVFVWGSFGVGPTGNTERKPHDVVPDTAYLKPVRVNYLKGEDITSISIGASHATGLSSAKDLFIWGLGSYGRLGFPDEEPHPIPSILTTGLPPGARVEQVSCGQSHTVLVLEEGQMYAWGHVGEGRLGVGTNKRLGVKEPGNRYFPTPTIIASLRTEKIIQVSCGSCHTLARSINRCYSWGNGAGGRLGLGDKKDRFSPTPIEALDGNVILDIQASCWHSAAIVQIPPILKGGVIYTWGSGYCGQLGQGEKMESLVPGVIDYLNSIQVFADILAVGSHHNAIIDTNGELWTWGSNKNNCLGRSHREADLVEYSTRPGHVGGFGAIIDRVGRGMPRAVACGKEFTLVSTYAYEGPSEEVAIQLVEERRLREKELMLQREQERLMAETVMSEAAKLKKRIETVDAQTAIRLCSKCDECPGFQYHAVKQNICRECGHSSIHHKKSVEE